MRNRHFCYSSTIYKQVSNTYMKKLLVFGALLAAGAWFTGTTSAQAAGAFEVSPTSYHFYYSIGGPLPTVQPGTFTNVTSDVVGFTVSVPNQPVWLNCKYTSGNLTTYPNSANTVCAAVDPTGLAEGTYTTEVRIEGQFTGAPVVIPITLHVQAKGTPLPPEQVHPEGFNVVDTTGTVYRIVKGTRQPYTSAGAFLSYSFNTWTEVVPANAADMALPLASTLQPGNIQKTVTFVAPRDGSLIRDQGVTYIVTNGYRQAFANEQVFSGLGYNTANVLDGDVSFMPSLPSITTDQMAHPAGTAVSGADGICVTRKAFETAANPTGKNCFVLSSDFNTWGIRIKEIVIANEFDTTAIVVK